MLKVLIAMTIAAAAAAVGQIFVRQGMQQVGALEQYAPLALMGYFGQALLNPYVVIGTLLNGVFYFLFLAALSWTDVTVVLPMTALEFGMAAILAVVLLNEVVPTMRWAGIALVIVGVFLIALAGGETA
ncbi:MAG: EamA family transporter [Nitrospira sp.]|jgi:drug/metabolite transporter (DMT)-like permease|nr:EamA family transporter [Nitrospira sp.]MDC8448049.1 DMT family transporter [Nitrospira sp.]MDI3462666.1 Permease of the drug/metabolite transporter (DMT) superfamily [Nitrospira sp.]